MARTRDAASLPEVVDRVQALWVWLDGRVVDFPTHARSLLGARVLTTALDLLDLILQAAYEPRASPTLPALLRQGNRRVALLRYLLRGARERRYLSTEQHAWAAERLDAIGRSLGAWERSQRERPSS